MLKAPLLESFGLLLRIETCETFVLCPVPRMLLPETPSDIIYVLSGHFDHEGVYPVVIVWILRCCLCNVNMGCEDSSCSERGRTSRNVRKGRCDEGC